MVTFKLIKIEDGFYYYEIYPEGDTIDKGLLVFNPEKKILKERIDPKMYGNDWIAKAISGLKDDEGNYKESGMVAWY